MKFGVVVLAHNAVPDIERLVLSLHNQNYAEWHGHILDVRSRDHLEKVTWPLHKIRDCGILKDRFRPHQIETEEDYNRAMVGILEPNPLCHVFAFVHATWRFDFDVFLNLHEYIRPGMDVIQVGVRPYHEGARGGVAHFCRRNVIMKYPPKLNLETLQWEMQFDVSTKIEQMGQMPFIQSFERAP